MEKGETINGNNYTGYNLENYRILPATLLFLAKYSLLVKFRLKNVISTLYGFILPLHLIVIPA